MAAGGIQDEATGMASRHDDPHDPGLRKEPEIGEALGRIARERSWPVRPHPPLRGTARAAFRAGFMGLVRFFARASRDEDQAPAWSLISSTVTSAVEIMSFTSSHSRTVWMSRMPVPRLATTNPR